MCSLTLRGPCRAHACPDLGAFFVATMGSRRALNGFFGMFSPSQSLATNRVIGEPATDGTGISDPKLFCLDPICPGCHFLKPKHERV